MKTFPSLSIAIPPGRLSWASRAEPPSPLEPTLEFPAIRERRPVESISKTALLLLKKTWPFESVATRPGLIEALPADEGVDGGTPPAIVEI